MELLPQNIEAEEAILGGILLDMGAIDRVVNLLKPQNFTVQAHQIIYQGFISLHSQGQPTDLIATTSWLADQKQLEKVGGTGKLVQLADRTISATNIDAYAQLVVDKSADRALIRLGDRIQQIGYDQSISHDEKLDWIKSKLLDLNSPHQEESFVFNDAGLGDWLDRLGDLYENGKPPVFKSNFYDLDQILGGGFEEGELIIIGGRPAMGKTAFATSLMTNFVKQNHATVMFSMEMTRSQIYNRIASSSCGIKYSDLKNGTLTSDQFSQVTESLGEWAAYPQAIDDASSNKINPAYIRSVLRRFEIIKGQPVKCIILDYLQMMVRGDNFNADLTRIVNEFQAIAKEFKLVFICLAQLNRGVEQRTNKRPTMSDLRDCGTIEQAANTVMMLYRDEYYNPESADQGIAEVIISKQRNGPTGSVKLLFDGEFSRFRNLAETVTTLASFTY